MTPKQKIVIEALAAAGRPLTASEIAAATVDPRMGRPRTSASMMEMLWKLKGLGYICQSQSHSVMVWTVTDAGREALKCTA